MEEVNKNNGWTVEILESKIEINEGILDLKYKNPAGSFVLSKEKILLDGRDGYLISLFAPEKYWQGLAGDIDKIVNSVTVKE
ncbi:MAG: hypothetical protein HYT20_00120 [Candidatus Nealsonbacteria bacterium]|nr:hypothetical protein [Candidatus Nealsonbacteria bacterium]